MGSPNYIVGHDEHGPAYPEPPYRCPICSGDESRYMTCEYPGCPDGRDPRHPHARFFKTYGPIPSANRTRCLVGWACAIALLVWALWPHTARGMDHGFDQNSPTAKWMESKIIPGTFYCFVRHPQGN